ncbi:hypothetical protein AVEN_203174-1 [Araneus ventricosus]|uniref:Uncharacterized protein n=1 Tax=Araneus ventricosus TaxID=182803 RepID=A0A4Y2CGW6_ARAVE|nr:hypothetical protein AVEN_203174-1 [Araneus ventricosus]
MSKMHVFPHYKFAFLYPPLNKRCSIGASVVTRLTVNNAFPARFDNYSSPEAPNPGRGPAGRALTTPSAFFCVLLLSKPNYLSLFILALFHLPQKTRNFRARKISHPLLAKGFQVLPEPKAYTNSQPIRSDKNNSSRRTLGAWENVTATPR